MIAFALARVTIVAVVGGHVLQLVPVDTALTIRVEALCIRMLFVGKAIALQLVHDLEQIRAIEHPYSRVRRQNILRGHFADRDPLFVGVVIAAELAGRETGTFERGRVQLTSDVLLRFILDRRVLANQLLALGIDGLDEEVDVGGGLVFRCAAFAVDCCCVIAGCFQSPRAVLPFPCDGDGLIARGMGLAGVLVKLSDEVVLVHRDRIGIRAILFGFGGVGVMGSKGILPESRIMICRARGAVYTNHQIPIDSRRVIVAGDVRRRILLAAVTGVIAVRFYAVAVFVSVHALVAVVAIAVVVAVFVYMLFPLRVERHGRGCAGQRDRRRSDVRAHRIHPALEVIALTDRLHRGDGERPAGGCRRLRLIGRHVRDRVVSDIIVVLQLVGVLGLGGLLRNEVNSVVILRLDDCISTRIKGIDNRIVAIRLRPADKFITLFQNVCCQQFLRSCLDRSNGNGVRANAVWAVRTMQRTGEGLLLPQVVLVALRVDAVINVQDIAVDLRVVVSGGCTLKIIVSSVLTIGKERGGAFTSTVAADASPGNVVNLIVVYTFPDVLGIRKRKRIIVDFVLAKVNRDVIADDFTYLMAADCITDIDFHAGDSVVRRRMQHDRAITRRHRLHRQHAEYHNQN